MELYEKPLTWGLSYDQMSKRFPMLTIRKGNVYFDGSSLTNFPGDCGALILTGANQASETTLKVLTEVASACGFVKIFATVVGGAGYIADAKKAFKKKRWINVYSGNSNRTPAKEDHVFVKIIRKPKWIGYNGKG